MLKDLRNEGKADGMKLNKKKTKIICSEVATRRLRTGVMIDAERLEESDWIQVFRKIGNIF